MPGGTPEAAAEPVPLVVFPDMPGMTKDEEKQLGDRAPSHSAVICTQQAGLPAAVLPKRGLASAQDRSGASAQSVRGYQMPYRTEAGDLRLTDGGAWPAERQREKPALPRARYLLWAKERYKDVETPSDSDEEVDGGGQLSAAQRKERTARRALRALKALPDNPEAAVPGAGLNLEQQRHFMLQYKQWCEDGATPEADKQRYEDLFRTNSESYKAKKEKWERKYPRDYTPDENPAWLPTWVCPRLQQDAVRKLPVIEDVATLDALVLAVGFAAYGGQMLGRWGCGHPSDRPIPIPPTGDPKSRNQYSPPFQKKAARAAAVTDCLRLLLVNKASRHGGGLTRAETDVLRVRRHLALPACLAAATPD